MSDSALAKAIDTLRAAAADAAWRQWAAIFNAASVKRRARAIVDPEALLLGSMALADVESRLRRIARLWAWCGSRLLSVQRAKNLAKMFPEGVAADLAEFASDAVTYGGDARWRSISAEHPGPPVPKAEAFAPYMSHPAALMLRLRLGLGVGIKADVLAFLLGGAGAASTIQEITVQTGYFGRAVRRAVEDLAAAGFIESRASSPITYRARVSDWQQVLAIDPDDPPAWRSWSGIYAWVAALSEWASRMPSSDLAAASEARDLWERHRTSLTALPGSEIRTDRFLGAAFLGAFTGAIEQWTEYIASVV